MENLKQQFLTNTDETGRFIVTSSRTGRRYFVEAIGDPHREWGSVTPGDNTAKLATKKGWKKYRGSVDEDESLITKENGFTKIHDLEPGISPMAYIDMLDAAYPDKT
jgi:hypothetical protein